MGKALTNEEVEAAIAAGRMMTPEQRAVEAARLGHPVTDEKAPNPPATRASSNDPPPADPEPLRALLDGAIERIRSAVRSRKNRDVEPTPDQRAVAARQAIIERKIGVVPPRFAGARINEVDDRIRGWVADFVNGRSPRGLLIAGPTGTGKTHALWAMYRSVVIAAPHTAVEVWKVVSLLDALRPERMIVDGPGRPVGVIRADRLASVTLLMLDDIGAHKQSEWVDERLYTVIDGRYDAMLPTVITTNIPPKDLSREIGDRLASRISESFDVVSLRGPDRRRA
jgi:predicted ATPase